MQVRIPGDLPPNATFRQRAFHLSMYCFAVLPVALHPEEIGLRVQIPANVQGFDEFPLQLIHKKPARFARLVRFTVEKDGKPHGRLVRARLSGTGGGSRKAAQTAVK